MRTKLSHVLPLCLLSASLLGGCGGNAILPGNEPPQIDQMIVNGSAVASTGADPTPPVQIETNKDASFICNAHDPNRDPLTYTWTGTTSATASQNNTSMATFRPLADGITTVTCTVQDERGGVVERAVRVNAVTSSNHPPVLTLAAASPSTAQGGTDLVTATATDPDSDPVTYSFFIVSGTGTITQSATDKSKATFTAPAATQSDVVLCVAADGKGGATTAAVTIAVP